MLREELRGCFLDLAIHKKLFVLATKAHEFGTFVAGERSERRVACIFACIVACSFVSALHPVAQRSMSLIQIFRDTLNAAVACLAQAYRPCFELR